MPSELNLAVRISAADLASPTIAKIHSAFQGLGGQISDIAKIGAGFAVGNIFAMFSTSLADKIRDTVTETTRFAEATFALRSVIGGTAESSSQLLAVFQRMGVSVDDASRNLGIFSKHLAGIEDNTDALVVGTKTFNDHMKDLGVTFQDAAGKSLPMNDVLLNVADKFAGMQDGVEKTALALALFGRAGRDMIPVLDLGRAGIEEAEAAATKYGLSLSGANIAAVRAYGFAHKDLDEAMQGLNLTVGNMLMPTLAGLATGVAGEAQSINQSLIPAVKDLAEDYRILAEVRQRVSQIGAGDPSNRDTFAGIMEDSGIKEWASNVPTIFNVVGLSFKNTTDALHELRDAMGMTRPPVQHLGDTMGAVAGTMRQAADDASRAHDPVQHLGDTMGNIALTGDQLASSLVRDHWAIQDVISAANAMNVINNAALASATPAPLFNTDPSSSRREAAESQKLLQSNLADSIAEAEKLKKSGSGIGGAFTQSSLTAIAGLSQIDMAIAGTTQKLAGVQLQIEQKVLSRMEARGAPRTLYGQEALLQEQLKVENLQKAANYTVGQEQLKISNAQNRAAHQTVLHPGAVVVNLGGAPTHNQIGSAVATAVINHLNSGAGTSPGKANTQLAGAR